MRCPPPNILEGSYEVSPPPNILGGSYEVLHSPPNILGGSYEVESVVPPIRSERRLDTLHILIQYFYHHICSSSRPIRLVTAAMHCLMVS